MLKKTIKIIQNKLCFLTSPSFQNNSILGRVFQTCEQSLTVFDQLVFCVSVKVKLCVPLLCVWVHSTW